MTRITTNLTGAGLAGAAKAAKPDPTEDPGAALQRLRLTGRAASSYEDVLKLDLDGVRSAARTIDAERVALEQAYNRGGEADAALEKIETLLGDAAKLAAANAKGLARGARKANQRKIDSLLAEVDRTAAEASPTTRALFDGSITLSAAQASVRIPEVSRAALGRVIANGRLMSLKDVASRGALDTSQPGAARAAGVRKAFKSATDAVETLRAEIGRLRNDSLRPRLGDVATVMAGLYNSASLGSGDEALNVARELRSMVLAGVTVATAVGAEGWDRERVLELLQP